MCGIEQVLQIARFPTQPPGKGTALGFPGVDGQTQKGPFSNPIPPPVGKGPERVLAAAITLAVFPHLAGSQFPHMLMGQYFPLSGSLSGSRRQNV